MRALLDPVSFLVVSLAGWMNQHQQHVIHYLIEENRVLREQIGGRRMRFSDDQRRRLAASAGRPRSALPLALCNKATRSCSPPAATRLEGSVADLVG